MTGHPAELPLRLYRGDSYAWTLRVWADDAATVPADLSDATAAAEIHQGPAVLGITCDVEAPNLVHLAIAAEDWTNDPPLVPGQPARYDVQLTFGDLRVYTLVAGTVAIIPDVTP